MTEALKNVIALLDRLPSNEQDYMATLILAVASASTSSSTLLEDVAAGRALEKIGYRDAVTALQVAMITHRPEMWPRSP
jgi:hypothetical protein